MLVNARHALARVAQRSRAAMLGRQAVQTPDGCARGQFWSRCVSRANSQFYATGRGRQSTGIARPSACQLRAANVSTALQQRKAMSTETTDSPTPLSPPPKVELDEDDIIETFVRGSGPGGQKINKTASCVMLRHVPSGIVVRCQESRSQHRNRELARRILSERLDLAVRGEHSRLAMEANRERARKAVKRRKAVKKHFKSRRDRAMTER